ncbi:hypothetical protein K501DRAFT_200191 [Backusella circina FSU 941]|nr:hypothetical protein K501DRAFT_200191 [Backusella circina FSU 941]
MPSAEYTQFMGSSLHERTLYIEKLIDIYANAIDSIFHTNNNPNIKIVPTRAFIQAILKKSHSLFNIVQTSLFYLFRVKYAVKQILNKETKTKMESMMCCGRRMFLASLMTASKYLQDKNYRNSAWCKITKLELDEINQLEMAFLKLIDYKLYVSKATFDKWYTKLHQHIQIKIPIVNNKHQQQVQTIINQTNVNQPQQQQQHNNTNNTHHPMMTLASPPASPITRFGMPSPPADDDVIYPKRRLVQDDDIHSKRQCV